jgi:cytochrome c553
VSLLRLVRAVLWSFFGVRGRADAARDLEGTPPYMIVAVGVALAALLVIGIVAVVRLITGSVPVSTPVQRVESGGSAPAVATKRHGPVVVADTMAERARPCTVCHGSTTQATPDALSPRIAGKSAGYLFNQLVSFRDGRRTYAPMVYLVQYMSDDYLREMASYFAQLELPHPPPQPAALSPQAVERARDIVEHGDPARGVPACVECHGTHLTGVEPGIPALLGLPRDYMNKQFGEWRAGESRSRPPDCMGEVARRLAPEDAYGLIAWLAAQPVTPGMNAEPAATRELPLRCGSLAPVAAAADAHVAAPLERGRYLVAAGDCVACHTALGGAPFSGGRPIQTPFGTVYSTNITPDAATGIGAWSREDFRRALREGRARDGHLLYPAFPYPSFTRVTRADADAMFDYLRTLAPVSRPNTPHAVRFPYDTQVALLAWRALYFRPGEFEPEAGRSADWNRGAYLVRGLGHCDACHAPRNILGAVRHNLDLGGGLIPMQNWYAPPLISTVGAGVASWEDGHIEALLRTGVSPRGTAMGPMGEVVYRSTQHLSVDDARAIATYLRSFAGRTPQTHRRDASDTAVVARGNAIYEDHCAECHGSDGEGALPAYPPLARNTSVTEPVAADAIKAVLYGGYAPVTAANPRPYGMPPFIGRLSPADIAAALSYVRASWGNAAPAVSELDIERFK